MSAGLHMCSLSCALTWPHRHQCSRRRISLSAMKDNPQNVDSPIVCSQISCPFSLIVRPAQLAAGISRLHPVPARSNMCPPTCIRPASSNLHPLLDETSFQPTLRRCANAPVYSWARLPLHSDGPVSRAKAFHRTSISSKMMFTRSCSRSKH